MSNEAEKTQVAESLLDRALAQVESASIREWVTSQRKVWIELGMMPLVAKHGPDCVERAVILIMVEAIGL
jgi:hypothetical protein